MSKKKKILLFLIIIFLAAVFTPLTEKVYTKLFGPVYSGFFWVSSGATLEGFVLSFIFFGSLLSWLFASKQKKYWLSYTLPFLIFMLLLGAFEELIIGIGLAIVGWLIGQIILSAKTKKQKL